MFQLTGSSCFHDSIVNNERTFKRLYFLDTSSANEFGLQFIIINLSTLLPECSFLKPSPQDQHFLSKVGLSWRGHWWEFSHIIVPFFLVVAYWILSKTRCHSASRSRLLALPPWKSCTRHPVPCGLSGKVCISSEISHSFFRVFKWCVSKAGWQE